MTGAKAQVDPHEAGLDVSDLLLVAEAVINSESGEVTPALRDALGTVLRLARVRLAEVVTIPAPAEEAEG